MTEFTAKRVVKEFQHRVPAKPERVFPLLCPVREYDWIDGWSCRLVWSESGVAEKGCVFQTNLAGRGEATWIVTRYEPDQLAIEFAIVYPGIMTEKLEVSLTETAPGETKLHWYRAYTGLSPAGNLVVEHFTTGVYPAVMDKLAKSLEHYLRTGEKLVMDWGF